MKEGASFCTNCGTSIRKKIEESPYTQTVQTSAQQGQVQQAPQPAPQQNVPSTPSPVVMHSVPLDPPQQKNAKSATGWIVAICITVPILIISAVIYLLFAFTKARTGGLGEPADPVEPVVDSRLDGTTPEIEKPVDANVYSPDKPTRTLMIYMVGSDLETGDYYYEGGAATDDLYEILNAKLPEDVHVVIECGGAKKWVHPDVPDGRVTRFTIENGELVQLYDLGKTTMTQQGDLSNFIRYAATYYPANNYSLVLWDHGGGIPVGFGCDELGDYYDSMCDYEIRQELIDGGVKFDTVIFDACNMCTLEMAMALDGYADYMVGAESYVNGVGIYYTDWLSLLDKDPRDYGEKIVRDYMDHIAEDYLQGSMSVIRLNTMDEVYEAYINYLKEAKKNLDAGDYSTYYQARGNCGYYEENDSVDLITLANSYQNSKSTPLINAVVNTVVYTESDFVYGHGLMAYSPYEAYDEYDYGRESFVQLNYDQAVLDFYDSFISQEVAYLGDDSINYGAWYDDEYEDYAEDYTYVSEYEIPVVTRDHYYGAKLEDEFMENLYYVAETVWVQDGNEYISLGEDYNYKLDSDGYFALVDPEAWVFINDNICTFYCYDYYSDAETGAWAQNGTIPVKVNGADALLYVYYDNESPSGKVMGYTYIDFETWEESDMYSLYPNDEVDVVLEYLDMEGNYEYRAYEEPVLASELVLQYEGLDLYDYTTYGYYTFNDVYGNIQVTDIYELGSPDYVE